MSHATAFNVRRIVMDVDKAVARPSLEEIARAVSDCHGVEAMNLTVGEIDIETVGMDLTVEGNGLDIDQIIAAIHSAGAVVHSVDQLVCGERLIEAVERQR
ncbi:DUF211 domain-containing protein [Luteibacter sp. CQ10]|uniref:DUF211 domain-containing protein n=1 Tax=Luteibacter sp. CQ10 TaxID=2805821 RepID=UPI0034A31BB6